MTRVSKVRSESRIRLSAEARLAQIINVSARVVSERGFWGLSLRDIAVECGITEAGILHHVGSKARLLVEILENRDELDRIALAGHLNVNVATLRDPSPPFGIRELFSATVQRNSEQREVVRLYAVLSGEALEPSHPAHEYFERREKIAMDAVVRAARVDGMPEDSLERQARFAMSALDGLQLRWLRDGSQIDLCTEWEEMAKLLFPPAASSKSK